MKEFIVKHPFISLLALDTIVCGFVSVVQILKCGNINTEEE